jgi:hypothetical protein
MEERMPQPAKSKKKLLQCSKGFEKKNGFALRAIEFAIRSRYGLANGLRPKRCGWELKNNQNLKFVVFNPKEK